MKSLRSLLIISLCSLLLSGGFLAVHSEDAPPVQWEKTFGGNGDDRGYSVQQTSDGGYIIVGTTRSFGAGNRDVWLIKTDASGNKSWEKTFGGSNDDIGRDVQQTHDGGYIIIGSTFSYGAGKWDVWLIKTDAVGNKEWDKTFGGTNTDYGYKIQLTRDSGYVITGTTFSFGAGESDVWLIKTDAFGNKLWDQTFGGSNFDEGYGIQQTHDGGYIIIGTTHSFGAGGWDVWLIKTDASGNKLWDRTFGSIALDTSESVRQTDDEGYIITGVTTSINKNDWDIWLIKTDAFGKKLWDRVFRGEASDKGNSVKQTRDGGYIIAGETQSFGAGDWDVWLIKTDALGNKIWDRTFGGVDGEGSSIVQPTDDGGYIIVGFTNSFGTGGLDVYLIKVAPQPHFPAQLTASLTFSDPSGNQVLDAEERGRITLFLRNSGQGEAYRLQVKTTNETANGGVTIESPAVIDRLAAGGATTVEIPVQAAASVASGSVRLKVEVAEANGFDLDPPAYITFNTKAFQPPKLEVADVGINDASGNGQIEPAEIVEITARLQNRGIGEARNVKADVQLGANVYQHPESKLTFDLGTLTPGAAQDITFSIFTNNKATSVPVTIKISEAHPQCGASVPLDLAFNRPQKRANELVVQSTETPGQALPELAALSVDVDQNIPTSRNRNPDALAVILGVERYANISAASYAKRDAAIFKEYAVKVLGVPDDKNHLYYRTDNEATKGEFLKIFTGEGWLAKRAQANSDVYIFYSGHGGPDKKYQNPYLIPYDGDVNYAEQTGIGLQEIYQELEKLSVRSITVFLDACFSGESREDETLLAEARPAGIAVTDPVIQSDKLTVFSASSGTQISSGYKDMKHGLFSYFLLKGLRGEADANNDDAITIAELESYLTNNVSRQAGLLDREQTPQVRSRDKAKVMVQY